MSTASENPSRVESVKVHGRWFELNGGIRPREVQTLHSGRQAGFEATATDGTTILAAYQEVEEWGSLRPLTEAEVAVISANNDADDAETFLRRHRIDEAGFNKLLAKQKGVCPGCNTALGDGRVHLDNGKLRHAYLSPASLDKPCSTIQYTF